MITLKTVHRTRFRIASGTFHRHSQGVPRNKSIVFDRFQIGSKVFASLEVPFDLWTLLKTGQRYEIHTTLINGKMHLIAVGHNGKLSVSKNYRNINQEDSGLVLMASFVCAIVSLYGMFSFNGSTSLMADAGFVISALIMIVALLTLSVGIWYSSTATDLEKAVRAIAEEASVRNSKNQELTNAGKS